VTDDPSFAAKDKGHDEPTFFLRDKYISLIPQNKNGRKSSAAGSLPPEHFRRAGCKVMLMNKISGQGTV
jgi:hypothetical protein